jgi:sugar lactone lactonase YvrE
MATPDTDPVREPIEKDWRGVTFYACPFPDCAFDTDNRATMLAHLDPASGKHIELVNPAAETPALTDDEHGELVALREEVTALRTENRTLKGKVTRLSKQVDTAEPEPTGEPMDALNDTTAAPAENKGDE